MIFCHGCGKQIHESAPSCPQCGAPQVQNMPAPATSSGRGVWQSVVAIAMALLVFAAISDTGELDSDQFVGCMLFCLVGMVFGTVGFVKDRGNRVLPVIGLVLCAIAFLAAIGSHT